MTKWLKKLLHRVNYSLRVKTLMVLLLGVILAVTVFVAVRFALIQYIDSSYNSDPAKSERAERYIEDLQNYITSNKISSQDREGITGWIHKNRFVYLLLYKDSELFFEGSHDTADKNTENEKDNNISLPGEGGFLLEYPDREELIAYAEKNGMYPIVMEDGLFLASIADFGDYFYFNLASTLSLVLAFAVLALALISYFHNITKRIANLADDVTCVAKGDMEHKISSFGKDELADLSLNVENMRESMLINISKEREARNANTELITSMSHDIRTPLTVLLGYIDLMKMENDPESLKNYLKASEQTALRLKELSDDMFKYFLVSGENIPHEFASYDAKTILEQMLYEHVLLLSEQGYNIELKMPTIESGMLRIRTDAPSTMRIIDNVFSNIRKYSDKEKKITITAECTDLGLEIIFENGISDKISERESSGIGMKTCMRLAELLGLGFSYTSKDDRFITKLRFPIDL